MLQQKTEETIGPYLLHDFFLFHAVRYACPPRKVFFLARQAFDTMYTPEEILHWMQVFYQRFFASHETSLLALLPLLHACRIRFPSTTDYLCHRGNGVIHFLPQR